MHNKVRCVKVLSKPEVNTSVCSDANVSVFSDVCSRIPVFTVMPVFALMHVPVCYIATCTYSVASVYMQ